MTRDDAIKVLKKVKRVAEIYESEDVKAYNMAIKALEQEPKTGRWTSDKKCSRCGCSSMLKLCIENYCANCGAKMVKSQPESEDKKCI